MEGINGRKPAKDFTLAECKRTKMIKQKYYYCYHVWRTQAHLIDGGLLIIAANQQIYTVTGGKTVTQVVSCLIQFQKVYKNEGGTHPSLRTVDNRT